MRIQIAISALLFLGLQYTHAQAQQNLRFQIPAESKNKIRPIAGLGSSAISLTTTSSLPYASPYTTNDAGTIRSFRYASTNGIGLEYSYGILEGWEFLLGAGYDSHNSQVGLGSTTSAQRNQFVKATQWPMYVGLRKFFDGKNVRPEIELTTGIAIGQTTYSQDFSPTTVRIKTAKPQGSLTAGVAIPWADTFSVHFQFGTIVSYFGKTTYNEFREPVSASTMWGFIGKASVRYQF